MAEAEVSNLLIVEPDPALLAMLTAYFSDQGFQFESVTTGSDALTAALKNRPRVILMETQLPDKAGLAVFRDLRRYPRTAHIPVLFLVGGTEIILINHILEAGARDVVHKPFDLAELGLRIKNALRTGGLDAKTHLLTRLPTADAVAKAVESIAWQDNFYMLEIYIEGYETFKDLNGFMSANEVMLFAANEISDIAAELGEPEDFVGHKEEGEFVVITSHEHGPQMQERLAESLNSQLPQFHNFMERDQGYMEVPDNAGNIAQVPLMHVTIVVKKS